MIAKRQISTTTRCKNFFDTFCYLYTLGVANGSLGKQKSLIYYTSRNAAPRVTIFVLIDSKVNASYLFIIYYSTLNRLALE